MVSDKIERPQDHFNLQISLISHVHTCSWDDNLGSSILRNTFTCVFNKHGNPQKERSASHHNFHRILLFPLFWGLLYTKHPVWPNSQQHTRKNSWGPCQLLTLRRISEASWRTETIRWDDPGNPLNEFYMRKSMYISEDIYIYIRLSQWRSNGEINRCVSEVYHMFAHPLWQHNKWRNKADTAWYVRENSGSPCRLDSRPGKTGVLRKPPTKQVGIELKYVKMALTYLLTNNNMTSRANWEFEGSAKKAKTWPESEAPGDWCQVW